jgi:hypothetical protein
MVSVVLVGTEVTMNFLSLKSASTKFELVIVEKLSNNIISFSDILCELEKVIVTTADPLVVVNALVSVVVDLIGCMS